LRQSLYSSWRCAEVSATGSASPCRFTTEDNCFDGMP
jgi:hypothetical protein